MRAMKKPPGSRWRKPSLPSPPFSSLSTRWRGSGKAWAVQPAMMVGHSIGEFVAATLAGVWELPDVLRIVALRGELMQSQPRGSMLAVSRSAEKVAEMLPPSLQLASNNSPTLCVASGPDAEIAAFAEFLKGQDIVCRRLHTSHAFHSSMMDPIVEPLRAEVAKVSLRPPAKPFVSTVTGRPITEAEATDPGYWARHARATVQFSKAVQWLVDRDYDVFLECGPRSTSCTLARQHFAPGRSCVAVPSLSDTHASHAEWAALLFALGSLWQNGVTIDWDAFYAHEERRRIPLPEYPFEHQRYWVDPAESAVSTPSVAASATLQGVADMEAAPLMDAGRAAASRVSSAFLGRAAIEQTVPRPANSPDAYQGESGEILKARLATKVVEILVPVSGRNRSEISSSASFLEQGFDSLSLTQAAFAIRKEFGVRVSFSQLMKEFPSVDMLAAHLAESVSTKPSAENAAPAPVPTPLPVRGIPAEIAADAPAAESAHPAGRLASAPELTAMGAAHVPGSAGNGTSLTHGSNGSGQGGALPSSTLQTVESTVPQRGIYYSSRLSEHLSASYNESMTLRLHGHISIPKLTRALERLAERHDALRADFDESGSVMRIAPERKLEAPVTDFSAIADPAAQEFLLRKLLAPETALPFTLPGGPLFRSRIVRLGAHSAAVIITGHHIICDGWSLDVLIRDFCAFYSQEISGKPAELPAAASFADYVRGYAQRANSREFTEAGDYWRSKFADGYQALVLPADHPRPARRGLAAWRIDFPVPAALVQSVRALGAKQGCSFFAIVLGALSITMARISRQRRFVIALPTADQPVIGQPDLVGHCVSLLPFAVNLTPGEAMSAFLSRVQRELAEAQDHSAFTLVNLLSELRPVTSTRGISPVPAGITNVKKYTLQDLPQTGFSIDYDANPMSFQSFEFYLNAVEAGDALELKCHYDTELFEPGTVQRWIEGFVGILRDTVADSRRATDGTGRSGRKRRFPWRGALCTAIFRGGPEQFAGAACRNADDCSSAILGAPDCWRI